MKAAQHMVEAGIDALIVCGGDGSLTGADMLRAEWASLIDELLQSNRITEAQAEPVKQMLTIVGLVGSIDNDMSSTDITIGANTSLHRICESLDSIVSTALSHQRAFVVEVMGRHCGWLALMAAIAVAADWVFLPERPPPLTTAYTDWETEMCESLSRARKLGNKKTIVIVSEGAIDRDLKPITGEQVKRVLESRLGLDTRVTTLGHVQRGGTPSAFDRYLATAQGAKAVDAVLEATLQTPSPMIGMQNNEISKIPLMEAVKLVSLELGAAFFFLFFTTLKFTIHFLCRHTKLPKLFRSMISLELWSSETRTSKLLTMPTSLPRLFRITSSTRQQDLSILNDVCASVSCTLEHLRAE